MYIYLDGFKSLCSEKTYNSTTQTYFQQCHQYLSPSRLRIVFETTANKLIKQFKETEIERRVKKARRYTYKNEIEESISEEFVNLGYVGDTSLMRLFFGVAAMPLKVIIVLAYSRKFQVVLLLNWSKAIGLYQHFR
ncbi:hypothetical protein BDA99DRAFT_532853 [Phascolomyces articulosus]|uniref:Uncharacterized protein n=1 Tax=Phascolomyces articulosus TaxID=60185 RepID=A0AAD5KNI9_9FUNG|nr:hypothetical protein BDA99DRAFT_532853 [Phascolomyces articulosus]